MTAPPLPLTEDLKLGADRRIPHTELVAYIDRHLLLDPSPVASRPGRAARRGAGRA